MRLMRNVISLFFVVVLTVSQSTLADNAMKHSRTMDLTTNPLWLVIGGLPLRFSFGVTDRIAVGLNLAGAFFGFGESKVLGVSGGVDAKFYLSGLPCLSRWLVC